MSEGHSEKEALKVLLVAAIGDDSLMCLVRINFNCTKVLIAGSYLEIIRLLGGQRKGCSPKGV